MLWNRAVWDAPAVPCLYFWQSAALTLLERFSYSVQIWGGRLEKEQADDLLLLTGKGRTRERTVSHVSGNSGPEQH